MGRLENIKKKGQHVLFFFNCQYSMKLLACNDLMNLATRESKWRVLQKSWELKTFSVLPFLVKKEFADSSIPREG